MSETATTPADTPANSPGAVLRRCREFHEISLEEASQTTKIGVSYLRSLENNNVGGFASLTYLKGFLRIYAAYLGLNADDMIRMYEKLYGAKDVKETVGKSPAKRARPARRMASLKKLVLPAVLLFLILITAALFKRQPSPTIHLSQPAAIPSVAPAVSAVHSISTSARSRPASQESAETKAVDTGVVVKNAPDKIIPSNASADSGKGRGFILKIKVTQNGNLNAAVDGAAAQAYELTVGDIIEWKAERSVALDLSDAGGVDVELNGRQIKQLGPAGKPAHLLLDAEGIKQ